MRRIALFVGFLALLGLGSAAIADDAQQPDLSTDANTTFKISAAHSYDLTGPYPFETLFSDMQGFNSPTVSGSAPDGLFVFNPPRTGSVGGRIQITFRNIQGLFEFACFIGSPLDIKVSMVNVQTSEALEKVVFTQTEMGENVFRFSTPPIVGRSDYVVSITATNATSPWNFSRCEVMPNF